MSNTSTTNKKEIKTTSEDGAAPTESSRLAWLKQQYPNLQWGIEMEVEGLDTFYHAFGFGSRFPKPVIGNLDLGTDMSVEGMGGPTLKNNSRMNITGRGYEFRTRLPWTEFPTPEVQFVVQALKTQQVWINGCCGLHIHFSGVLMSLAQVQQLREKLLKHIKGVWYKRRTYCKADSLLTAHHSGVSIRRMVNGKDSLIITGSTPAERIAQYSFVDWAEARVFNMSSSFRGIHQSWQRVINALYEVMVSPH